jgi:hypothetical protein
MVNESQFWKIVGGVVTTIVITIALYNYMHNISYYDSWNKCVEANGQPTEQAIVGSSMHTFTCIRK